MISRYSDKRLVPQQYQKIQVPRTSVRTPFQITVSDITEDLLHQREPKPRLQQMIICQIKAAVREFEHSDHTSQALDTSSSNLIRYYRLWLAGTFIPYSNKLIIVTKDAVYATEYKETELGELSSIMEISRLFREEHAAVMPSQGYFTSEWVINEQQMTEDFPHCDNSVSVVVRNTNAWRRFNVPSTPSQ